MPHRLTFDADQLHTIAGGKSAIDSPKLNIHSMEEANSFLLSYGFDYSDEQQAEKLWYYHRRSFVLLTETLGYQEKEIPEMLRERRELKDLRHLLMYASQTELPELQRWSCAFLRAIHVFVHSENDLFSAYSEEIQKQILTPLEKHIVNDGTSHRILLHNPEVLNSKIELHSFQIKPFKGSTSTVIKLLAKPDALAMRIYDKLGVRFVTKNLFDTFQVMRFLIESNMTSYAHIIPDQSSNNLYPVDLFIQVCDEVRRSGETMSSDQMSDFLEKKLKSYTGQTFLFRKDNSFSGFDYKFIKFITRKLVRIQKRDGSTFSFFFPYEIQVMDINAYEKILSGPSEHQAYKTRQKEAARQRLFHIQIPS